MNKKKFLVLALLMIAVIALTSCMLVACNTDEDTDSDTTETIEATEGLLISNGDFKVVGSTSSYPSSITSWTGAKMYSSGNYKSDVTSGAINLDKAVYDKNKSKWNDDDDTLYNLLTANGRYNEDDIKNALMIYMPTESTDDDGNKINGPTAYGYTSSTFTLARGSYYKLTVDVLTYNIAGSNEQDRGARIYVSSNTYAEFDGIDTNGQWKTYEIIIESSPSSTTTLSVMLGLGKYSASYTTGLTTGYAVFDNLSLVKIDENGESAYNDAVAKELNGDNNITTATLKVSNGRFDFGTTTVSSSGTPNGWSLVKGNSGESDSAPTSLGYNGIIDVANFADNYKDYSSTYYLYDAEDKSQSYVPAKDLGIIKDEIAKRNGIVGTNVFMLSQQMMTAQGIKSSRSITIEKNKTYALSIDLYTYAVHGAGVSLVLSGSDGKDITIKGISTNKTDEAFIGNNRIDDTCHSVDTSTSGATTNGWQTYTFYIEGNQYRDFSYTMTIWLGTEGTNSNTAFEYTNTNSNKQTTYTANGTFSTGWVFIDELNLKEIESLPAASETILGADTDQTLDIAEAGKGAYTALCVDLTSTNILTDILTGSDATTNSAVDKLGTGAPAGWTSEFDTTDKSNPIISNFISEGIVNIADEDTFTGVSGTYPGLPYDIENKVAYQLYASKDSYYEVQTQTFTIAKNSYYRVSLWVKTVDVKSTSGAYVYLINADDEDATLTSFTQINTNDEDGFDEYFNDWCELTLYIRGSQKEDTNVALKLTLGTGNRWASETLTSGSMFVTNINGAEIDYSAYKGATTGTYTKSVNLADSAASYTFTNGSFDEYDESDDKLEESKPLSEQTVAGTPSSWTFSDKTLNANSADSSLIAGIIALNSNDNGKTFEGTTQSSAVLPSISFDGFYPSFDDLSGENYNVLPGQKGQLLAIGSKDSEKYAAGYTSQSLSLSANGFYKLSVWVKTLNGAKASVYLTGESAVAGGANSTFVIESTTNSAYADWTNYVYYLATGNNSVSIKLNLWLGQDKDYVTVDEHTTEDSLKSSGVVFFDNVVYQTIDEDDYTTATAGDTVKKLSFTVDSFDSLSSTTSSRDSLTTPNGWTGTVGSASGTKSSYTKSGVIYIDGNFLTSDRELDGKHYIDILGKDYDVDSDDDELKLTDSETEGKSDDEIAALKQAKADALKKANWITLDELEALSGKQALVINNTRENQYTYTSSTMTLKEESYYKISVYVRTLKLAGATDDDEHIGANVELYLGSANESDNPFIFKTINTEGEWTQYTFYVQTLDDDVTSVTIKLSLGNAVEDEDDDDIIYGLTRGYAFFDDVAVEKIDEEAFENAEEGNTVLVRTVSNETSGKSDEDEDDDDTTTSSGFNTEYLWWMVPTIVLAVLIIVVLVVYLVRKVKKPVAKKVEKKVATIKETPSLDTKHDKYDENKE